VYFLFFLDFYIQSHSSLPRTRVRVPYLVSPAGSYTNPIAHGIAPFPFHYPLFLSATPTLRYAYCEQHAQRESYAQRSNDRHGEVDCHLGGIRSTPRGVPGDRRCHNGSPCYCRTPGNRRAVSTLVRSSCCPSRNVPGCVDCRISSYPLSLKSPNVPGCVDCRISSYLLSLKSPSSPQAPSRLEKHLPICSGSCRPCLKN
jgi:hypothetical protein